jgi:hypothetical protein
MLPVTVSNSAKKIGEMTVQAFRDFFAGRKVGNSINLTEFDIQA